MKKWFVLMCVTMLMLTPVVAADSSNDLTEIKVLLESGRIKNYETIMIPLRGDPENFNILPTDDLKTISFGEGVEGYRVKFDELEDAYNSGEQKISPYLEKEDKYYFPIIVSGREVAMAEIIKKDGEYKVFSVSSGILFDNFIQIKDGIDLVHAKYISEGNAINGLVLNAGTEESFIDLDVAENEVAVSTAKSKTLVEEFMERKIHSMGNSGELGGAGENTTIDKTDDVMCVAGVFLVLICLVVFLLVRKKKVA